MCKHPISFILWTYLRQNKEEHSRGERRKTLSFLSSLSSAFCPSIPLSTLCILLSTYHIIPIIIAVCMCLYTYKICIKREHVIFFSFWDWGNLRLLLVFILLNIYYIKHIIQLFTFMHVKHYRPRPVYEGHLGSFLFPRLGDLINITDYNVICFLQISWFSFSLRVE